MFHEGAFLLRILLLYRNTDTKKGQLSSVILLYPAMMPFSLMDIIENTHLKECMGVNEGLPEIYINTFTMKGTPNV